MVLEIREKVGKKFFVTCDGERYCRCYPGDLRELGFTELSEGQRVELSEQSLAELEKTVFLTRAKRRSLFLLGKKEYTEQELCRKFSSDGYPESVTKAVISWLKELRYVDDFSYAERYAFSLLSRHSEREILQKMQQKGFERNLVKEALAAAKERYSEEHSVGVVCNGGDGCEKSGCEKMQKPLSPETEAIRSFLRKKGYSPESTDPEKRKKLVASLYRKGFSMTHIREVMGELSEEYWE